MNNQDFTTTILVDESQVQVFNAVKNVRGWWSERIDGDTEKRNDEFNYEVKDLHRCRMKLIEVIPDEKVVWLVLDNFFSFTKDQSEWKDTKIFFEMSKHGDQTQLRFTHEGLTPAYECFDICKNAWADYIHISLLKLIKTGKGMPNNKDGRVPDQF